MKIHEMEIVTLPPPRQRGRTTIEECLTARRSIRTYQGSALSAGEIGQLLWAAQGVTGPDKQRTAPSAGALYPLEMYLVAGNIKNMPPGVFRYNSARHQLLPLASGDKREELAVAAHNQDFLRMVPAILAITGSLKRIAKKYPEKALHLMTLEAGHVVQNFLLQAVALGLGTVPVGAFDDAALKRILKPSAGEEPLYMVAVGRPQ